MSGIDARTIFWVSLGAVCLVLIAALYWQNIQRWRYRDARRWADAQHVEVALPLDGKEAASTCGKLLKIDKVGFISKLDILERMKQVVRDGGFSDEEIKELGSLLGEMAYFGYTFGYMTFDIFLQSVRIHFDDVMKNYVDSFLNKPSSEEGKQMEDKPLQSVTMEFDDEVKMTIDSFLNKLSSEQRKQMATLLPRINHMQLRAFDLGRRDARLSPCPY